MSRLGEEKGRTSWDRGVGRETEGGPVGGANFGGRWGAGKKRGGSWRERELGGGRELEGRVDLRGARTGGRDLQSRR